MRHVRQNTYNSYTSNFILASLHILEIECVNNNTYTTLKQ